MQEKQTFKSLLAGFAIIMLVLPPFAALNSYMTHSLESAGWYKPIELFIVPWQARMVAAAIAGAGIESRITPNDRLSTFYMIKDGAAVPVDLAWNCLGWQSVLLLIVSLVIGMRGRFTGLSRFKCVALGLTGTLLVNIFRMSFIAILIFYANSFAANIVHDYFAAFVTVIWLMFFWWFSYKYVLENESNTNFV